MPPPPRKPIPDGATAKVPAHPAPVEREDFIGNDAPTLVGIDMNKLKEAHDAKKAAAAAPAPAPVKAAAPARAAAKAPAPPPEPEPEPEEEGESSGRLTPAQLETMMKVRVPSRLKRFFDSEAVAHEGQLHPDIVPLPLRVLAGELMAFWEYAADGHFKLPSKRLLPFAVLGEDDGTYFVAVDAGVAALPVHFFDYEEGFQPLSASLDDFLAELTGAVDGEDESDGDEDQGSEYPASDKAPGPNGGMLDSDGQEWDWVTNEGVGFMDTDGEDEMVLERNGKTYFKPDWGDWDSHDWVGYWSKIFAIEAGQGEGDEAWEAAIHEAGLRNVKHLERVKQTFLRHYADDAEFTNAALVARQEQSRGAMKKALKPGGLDPIEGVSLQVFAAISAQRASLDAAGFKKLLAKHKIDEAKFAKADAGWMARMSDQSDPMAAMAVATEYGKAFSAGATGQFADSAQAASGSLGINDKVAGKNVKGKEPMPFEKYVEISAAQAVWAEQGKDVNAQLKKVFNMNAVDFSNASAYWSQKMSTDIKLMMEVYTPLDAKYRAQYRGSGGGADDDLDV